MSQIAGRRVGLKEDKIEENKKRKPDGQYREKKESRRISFI